MHASVLGLTIAALLVGYGGKLYAGDAELSPPPSVCLATDNGATDTDKLKAWMKANGGASGIGERIFNDDLPSAILNALTLNASNVPVGWRPDMDTSSVLAAIAADMRKPVTDPEEIPFE